MDKYLTPPSNKVEMFDQPNWRFRDSYFTEDEIHVSTKDSLQISIQDEMDDKDANYRSFHHEYWCDILPTLAAKDNRKRYADQIKKLSSPKAVVIDSDCDAIPRVPRNKKASAVIMASRKQNNIKKTNPGGIQCYCVVFNNTVMTGSKHMSHSADTCFGKGSYQ